MKNCAELIEFLKGNLELKVSNKGKITLLLCDEVIAKSKPTTITSTPKFRVSKKREWIVDDGSK